MDNFIVSARKYRPVTFDSVVGQQHITSTLKNAIMHNQLAQAFLFCGPRGVGKTTCARILAKTINCQNVNDQVEACGECESCRSFAEGASFSIHELDAASNNSVDDIRNLIDQVRIPPQTGKYKIYIIDEVHMLSQAAFNAFLKTLEEPPNYAIFILATTEKHKILPTILSRCQIFDFNRIRVEDMSKHLASIAEREDVAYEVDGLHIISQKADGGLRDALSMFDQIVSFSNRNVTYQAVIDNLNILDYDYYFKLLGAIGEENAAEALLILDDIMNKGFDAGHFIAGLSNHLRHLLLAKEPRTVRLLEVSDGIKQKFIEQSAQMNVGMLLSALNIANQCEIAYRTSENKRLQVELALLKMCHLNAAINLAVSGKSITPTEVKKKLSTKPIIDSDPESKIIPPTQEPPAVISEKPLVSNRTTPSEPKQKFSSGKGWGTIKTSIATPSLSSVFEEKEKLADTEPNLVIGTETREIEFNEFIGKWNELADRMRQESRITIYTIMTANLPRLKGNIIEIDVENVVQSDQLKEGKIDILNFLRTELRNFALDVEVNELEQSVIRKAYTSQEKYQVMIEKNPSLDLLRRTFNLGLS